MKNLALSKIHGLIAVHAMRAAAAALGPVGQKYAPRGLQSRRRE